MAVSIFFPDGSQRRVPGQLKQVDYDGGELHFVQVPINCDPLWRFVWREEAWHAVARHAPEVAFLTPRTLEWWRRSGPMGDEAPASTKSAAA